MVKHKCFISFKVEDKAYKEKIQRNESIEMIDKSLNEPINSDDPDYVMQKIRNDNLKDSSVTIFLIGNFSAETLGEKEQYYMANYKFNPNKPGIFQWQSVDDVFLMVVD